MATEVSIYEPRTMGRIVQKLPPVRTFFRSTFFKNTETFVTEKVDVDFVKGSRKVALAVFPLSPGDLTGFGPLGHALQGVGRDHGNLRLCLQQAFDLGFGDVSSAHHHAWPCVRISAIKATFRLEYND